jgi:hypothetical protein
MLTLPRVIRTLVRASLDDMSLFVFGYLVCRTLAVEELQCNVALSQCCLSTMRSAGNVETTEIDFLQESWPVRKYRSDLLRYQWIIAQRNNKEAAVMGWHQYIPCVWTSIVWHSAERQSFMCNFAFPDRVIWSKFQL